MASMKTWIKAFRLRTLPLSLSGIILGSAIAGIQGAWDGTIFSLAMLTTLCFQILSNLANDLGDSQKGTDNEYRIGPMRAVQSGEISFSAMKKAVILASVFSFLSAGLLIYVSLPNLTSERIWMYIILAILCVAAAITYTVGKNAYGYLGLGDLFVFLFFGLVSVLGVFGLYASTWDYWLILPACSIGFLSTAVLNLNNMRDQQNDAVSGKRTLVVKMGPNGAKVYHAFLIIFSFVALTLFIGHQAKNTLFIALIPFVILLFHLRKAMQVKDFKDFDPELKKVALSTFFVSILFLLAWIVQGVI